MPNKDNKAPGFLELTITDSNGKPWGKIIANAKEFSTGSLGFYASGKIVNPENPEAKYQVGGNITLIGSKPEKK